MLRSWHTDGLHIDDHAFQIALRQTAAKTSIISSTNFRTSTSTICSNLLERTTSNKPRIVGPRLGLNSDLSDAFFRHHPERIHFVCGCHFGRNFAGSRRQHGEPVLCSSRWRLPAGRSTVDRSPKVSARSKDRRAFTVPLQCSAMTEPLLPHLRGLQQTAVFVVASGKPLCTEMQCQTAVAARRGAPYCSGAAFPS